jgi:zinc D-Ala-D-Ala dipeptidase
MKWKSFLFLCVFFCSCSSNDTNKEKIISPEGDLVLRNGDSFKRNPKVKNMIPEAKYKRLYFKDRKRMLVVANEFNEEIFIELKYATKDNFMKRKLYDTLKTAYLQLDVAQRLAKAQDELSKINPNYHLLVYDATRPLSVQWEMWTALDSIPVGERVNFVSNPRNGSVHNYGAAVDLTICDKNGKPLDMGAGYDDIRKIAYPSLEAIYLKSGELTKKQVENRKLLRKVMTSQGFRNIPTEWWHFNACSREEAKIKYSIIQNEF